MSEWNKLKDNLIDFIKSCDDTPTEERNRIMDLLVGGLIGEGDKLNSENIYLLGQYAINHDDLKKRVTRLEETHTKLEAVRKVVEENRSWLVLDLDGAEIIRLLDEVL